MVECLVVPYAFQRGAQGQLVEHGHGGDERMPAEERTLEEDLDVRVWEGEGGRRG